MITTTATEKIRAEKILYHIKIKKSVFLSVNYEYVQQVDGKSLYNSLSILYNMGYTCIDVDFSFLYFLVFFFDK